MNKGVVYAVSAYIFWGLHPIYWKQLQHVPPVEIVSYRILWSLVFFTIIVSSLIAGTYAPPAVHEPITMESWGIPSAESLAWL